MNIRFGKAAIVNTAAQVLQLGRQKKVWVVNGEMGAGKTTLIQAVCRLLGVESAMGSPTYSIINEYQATGNLRISHIDLYRLRDEEEAIQAGVEDSIYNSDYSFIEWAEKAPGLVPEDVFTIDIKVLDAGSRQLITS